MPTTNTTNDGLRRSLLALLAMTGVAGGVLLALGAAEKRKGRSALARTTNPKTHGAHFAVVDDMLSAIEEGVPNAVHVSGISEDALETGQVEHGRRVSWWFHPPWVVKVDVDKIAFMDGNLWNIDHAAGVREAMRQGETFEIPRARVHRITADDVKQSLKYETSGELEEQLGMVRPWTRDDIGTYRALLIDGNHRALAAMSLGELTIPVYVGEMYRAEIRKKDWLREGR